MASGNPISAIALRFSKFKEFDDFERAFASLDARAAKATTAAERSAVEAEARVLQDAYNRFTANMSMPKGAPAMPSGPVSASERAVIESKYPGRYLDPETGYPQSYAGKPVMADPRKPEEAVAAALNTVRGRPAETPSWQNYLFEKSRRLGVDGKPVTVEEFGYTPGQRLAQAGAAGVVGGALGASAMRDKESQMAPISNFTGTDVDAEALTKAYGAAPEMERPSPFEETNVGAPEPVSRDFPKRVPDILAPVGPPVAERAVQRAKQTAARPTPVQTASVYADNPTASPGMLSRIFGGGDYQSTGKQVVERPQGERPVINWGSNESAADYFRAAQALQSMKDENPIGRASGGKADNKGGIHKDAALHKALEIIHAMISRQ